MKKQFVFPSLILTMSLLFFVACQKEYSFEKTSNPSRGSLQSEVSGECLPKTVNGIYEAGTVLDGTNYIDVQVNVTTPGSYLVKTDTVNGIFFQATGAFADPGLNTVRLLGNGTPQKAGIQNYIVSYDSTTCNVAVTTLPKGGNVPAVFTLESGGATCMNFILEGTYIKGQALTAANKVTIHVNVTAIGTYTITTTSINGITFSGTGVLAATGAQTIVLTASGTPVAEVSTTIPIAYGASSCSFSLNVTGPAAFTIDCGSAATSGVFEKGKALVATNTIELDVNVTTIGAYAITTTAVNGMTFSGSGTFAATGLQTITLTGTGTPAADGTFAVTVTGAGATCAVDVDVNPAPPGADMKWQFTSGGTTYQGPTDEATVTSMLGMNILTVGGGTASGMGSLVILLTSTNGAITTGNYSGTASAGKIATFAYNDLSVGWQAGLGQGVAVNVTVTQYNTTTRIIEGTFSGEAKPVSGAKIAITAGSFKATLP